MRSKKKYRINPRRNDPHVVLQFPQALHAALHKRAAFKNKTVMTEVLDILCHVLGYDIAFHPEFITVGTRVIHHNELVFTNKDKVE